jgi:hypothetical protein
MGKSRLLPKAFVMVPPQYRTAVNGKRRSDDRRSASVGGGSDPWLPARKTKCSRPSCATALAEDLPSSYRQSELRTINAGFTVF